MNEGRYPSDEELSKIEKWDGVYKALLDFVGTIWTYGKWGFKKKGNTYTLITGGWSGNEEIIHSLKTNVLFWSTCWESSERGGKYVFKV